MSGCEFSVETFVFCLLSLFGGGTSHTFSTSRGSDVLLVVRTALWGDSNQPQGRVSPPGLSWKPSGDDTGVGGTVGVARSGLTGKGRRQRQTLQRARTETMNKMERQTVVIAFPLNSGREV